MDAFEALLHQIKPEEKAQTLDEITKCFRNLFSTPEGQRALDFMSELWLDGQLFVPKDPHHSAYNMGHADLINFFKDCVRAEKG